MCGSGALSSVAWSQWLAIHLLLVPIGVGVGIGIGIDSYGVWRRGLMYRVASLSEFRQHRHDAVQHRLAVRVLIRREGSTHVQDILSGAALQRGTACDLKIATAIAIGGFAVAFGNIQRDRLRSAQKLVLGVAMALQAFAESVGPAHILDRRAIHIQFLVGPSGFLWGSFTA